jgi:hypothetical protein
MRKLIPIFIFLLYSTIVSSQINVGNNQTICLADTAEVIATVQASGQCVGMDTVICGTHASNYTAAMTRGYHFQAQSSFVISGLMCATDNSGPGFNQSVQVVAFGDSINGVWVPSIPNSGLTPHITLFSSIDDSTANYIFCNISVDSGQYYGILGARHMSGGGSAGTMYNSYSSTAGATVMIDGNTTLLSRLYYQASLAGGVAPTGSLYATSGQISRIHILTGGGVTWYDLNSGYRIGNGDTLHYAPTQTTWVKGIYECAGQTYSDSMRISVSNTQIAPSGLSLCNGPVTLTAAPNFALYVWNNNSASPQLLVTSPGTYYVNCTSSNGSVCQSPPVIIYADTIPISVIPRDTTLVCPGDTVYLQVINSYTSYLWNTGATSQNILADSTGSYWAYAIDANGCVASTDTAHIVTNELNPNIWSTYPTICNNGPIIAFNSVYTDNIYQSYAWGSSFGSTGTFSSMSAPNPGTYWVTVTDQYGCSGTSDTLTIHNGNFNFNLLPSDSVFLCNAGSSITLDAANSMTVASYQWNNGATTPTITTNTTGSYYCTTMTTTGCYGFSDTVEVFGINPQLSYSGLSLCSGPVSLNTGNYDMYQWSNSVATQSISVNQAGDYYVFVTDSNGCTAYSDTISIYTNNFQYNINPSGSTTICPGYSVDLDAGSQFTNHLWNTGATTSTITPSTIGQYYASMTDVNGCSGYTDTITITNMSVNLSTTGYSLCNPQAYPVLDAGSGYYIYNWSNGDTTSSITASLPGNYHVNVIDQNGCTASSDTITIYLNQFAFDINSIGTDSICQPNGQVALDAGSGYFSYLWSSGGNSQQTVVNAAGNYTVNVMDMNGCSGTSNPFIVHNIVSTSQITGLTNVIQNDIENYSVIQNPNSAYNWGVVGGLLQSGLGTNSVDILWNNPGMASLYVIETDINGCVGDTINLSVTVFMSTDIQENQDLGVSIHPNPFTKETYLTIDNQDKEYSLSLYDVTGHKIWSKKEITSKSYKINREKLADGIYFLELVTDNNQKLLKLVIN